MPRLALVLTIAIAPALLAQQTSPQVSPPEMSENYNPLVWQGEDANFALNTLQTNFCAGELSKLAASRTTNLDLHDLAQSAAREQTGLHHKLRSLAKAIGIWLPPDSQLQKCSDLVHARSLSGAEFDKTYLASLQRANEANISAMQAEIARPQKPNNAPLRHFASEALPHLEKLQTQTGTLSR